MGNPFEAPGDWFRCALHAHTTNSDGELPPQFLTRHYEWAGFDVLALTDHWVRSEAPSTEKLLVIPSVEVNTALDGNGRVADVLALGVDASFERSSARLPTFAESVAWTTERGGVPYLAHPYWSGLTAADLERCDGVLGLEVYNAGCELEGARGLSCVHWDYALEAGRRWLGIAVDDSHHPGFDSGFAWTWVRASERSREAILAALAGGTFYSSTGPVIEDVVIDGTTVEVRCTPARQVTLITGPARGVAACAGRLGYRYRAEILERDAEGLLTAVRLVARPGSPYARLEVRGGAGETAWTNPLWP